MDRLGMTGEHRSGAAGAGAGRAAMVVGTLLALLSLALLGSALQAQTPPPPPVPRVTVMVTGEPSEELVRALMRSRAVEERLARELARTADEARRRTLEAQLNAIVRTNAGLLTRLELQCGDGAARPTGYLGVSFSGDYEVTRDGHADPAYRFRQYPRIESVEPGSPADEAGVAPGDRLIALDRLDLLGRPVVFHGLLKPGKRVTLRLRRDRQLRDLSVLVGARPGAFGSPCAQLDELAPVTEPLVALRGALAPLATVGEALVVARGAAGVARGSGEVARGAAEAATRQLLQGLPLVGWVVAGGSSFVAGAQVRALDDDLRDLTGVDRGVFVVSVAPGTPAREAGLRAGDVITAADETPVASAAALQRQVAQARDRRVTLDVARKGRTQRLTLGW